MTQDQQADLTLALERAGAIDNDIMALPELQAALAEGKSAVEAVKALAASHPALFTLPRDWGELHGAAFDSAEAKLRKSLSSSRPITGLGDFRDLDTARLSDEEQSALRRVLTAQSNSWDKSLLTRALGRQRQEDALAFPPDAA